MLVWLASEHFDSFFRPSWRRAENATTFVIHAYCLMETHWHLALWAHDELCDLVAICGGLSTTHASSLSGWRLVPAGTDTYTEIDPNQCLCDGPIHYLALLRYIEANPMAAGLVSRAEDWCWSSLHERTGRSPAESWMTASGHCRSSGSRS